MNGKLSIAVVATSLSFAFACSGLGGNSGDYPWTITEISPEDAYYADASDWVGVNCRPDAPTDRGDNWYGGSFDCENGEQPYFYKARMDTHGVPFEGEMPVADVPEPVPPVATGAAGPKVKLVEISAEDAYYGDRDDYIGRMCAPISAELREPGWYGGSFKCDGDWEPYFYKARFLGDVTTPAAASAVLAAGKSYKLVEIGEDDAYYANRDQYIGRICRADQPNDKGGGWYGGSFKCDGDWEPYFFRARLVPQ